MLEGPAALPAPPVPSLCCKTSLGSLWASVDPQRGFIPLGSVPSWGPCAQPPAGRGLRSSAGSSPLPTALPPANPKYLGLFLEFFVKWYLEDMQKERVPCKTGPAQLSHTGSRRQAPRGTGEGATLGLGVTNCSLAGEQTELMLIKQHHLQSPVEANCLSFGCQGMPSPP